MSRRDPDDVVLSPELLLRAYAAGIFPMAEDRHDPHVFWVDPKERGVFPLDAFHVPKSLRKTLKKGLFDVRADSAFEQVLDACAAPYPGRTSTWINAPIRNAVMELYRLGFAHSMECWRNGMLVGGLYGISLGGAFFGESMFSRERDASKVALVHLVARLRIAGYKLLDAQFVTEHLARFGCVSIPSRDYLVRLEDALQHPRSFPPRVPAEDLQAMLETLYRGPEPEDAG